MKILIIVLCVVLGLAGLFMSACGGYFTVASLMDKGALGIAAISVPILLVGTGCIWGAVAGIRRATRKPSEPEQR
jgi:hypothetical protein